MIRVLESVKRLPVYSIGPIHVSTLLFVTMVVFYVIWAEVGLARTIRRLGRGMDTARLSRDSSGAGSGRGRGLYLQRAGFLRSSWSLSRRCRMRTQLTWRDGAVLRRASRRHLHGLLVLARIALLLLVELVAIRGRRLYSIARLSIYESNRRMWAPWVVITVFLLVLAFTHWFLQPPRVAEMGRLYVGTLSLLCSVLLTVMVTILTPLSLPTDIQQQTIYTVVSKPVRRLELIWGRMIGYMALVTLLVAAFGGISLAYLWRTVGNTITATEQTGVEGEGRGSDERLQGPHRAGRPAPDPDVGSRSDQGLSVVSRLARHAARDGNRRGGGAGGMKEPRSHIEGATPSTAIWSYGRVPDPFTPAGPGATDPRPSYSRGGFSDRQHDRMATRPGVRLSPHRSKMPNVTRHSPTWRRPRWPSSTRRSPAIRPSWTGRESEYDSLSKRADDLKAQATQAAAAGDAEKAKALQRRGRTRCRRSRSRSR